MHEFFKSNKPQVKLRYFKSFAPGQVRLELKAKEYVLDHVEPWKERGLLKHHHPVGTRLRDRFSVR